MAKYFIVACMALFALVAVADEPVQVIGLELEPAPVMTPASPADLQLAPETVPLIDGGGDCGEAGDSCTSDSNCCKDLFCTDNANQNPNTCQAIASPAPSPGPIPINPRS